VTQGQSTEEGGRLLRLRDELERELRDSPEVETVAVGKKDGEKALVVLVKKSAPEHLKERWHAAGDRSFKGVPVIARDWGSARVPAPPGVKLG
jgi:hypothetical protein